MKILFISNTFRDYKYYPLGLLYLSSVLKHNGHIVAMFSGNIGESLLRKVKLFKPSIIGYSVLTGSHQLYLSLNLYLKDNYTQPFISIFGGPHPTFFPQIIYENGVDAICRGEGEEALLEFVEAINNNKEFTSINNFWVKQNNRVFQNNLRPKIKDINNIPFPDIGLIGKNQLRRYYSRFVIASRGCPFQCTYCFNHAYNQLYNNQNIVRIRSVDNVIFELETYLKNSKYKVHYIKFLDDNFVVDIDWLQQFAHKYIEKINLPFNCFLRPEYISDIRVSLLKIAGCTEIVMGIETGDETLRKNILNRNTTNAQIIKAAQTIKKFKILLTTENMIGLPEESVEQAFKTIYLNIKCKTDIPIASVYTPYPGTKLGEYCMKQSDTQLGNGSAHYVNLIGQTYFSKSILNIPNRIEKENIASYFAILVKVPLLIPIMRPLLHLKLSAIGSLIFKLQFSYFAFKKHGFKLFSPLMFINQIFDTVFGKSWKN